MPVRAGIDGFGEVETSICPGIAARARLRSVRFPRLPQMVLASSTGRPARTWRPLPVAEVAAVLGSSTGNVQSQTTQHRRAAPGLAALGKHQDSPAFSVQDGT
jgi:hypothetical protein